MRNQLIARCDKNRVLLSTRVSHLKAFCVLYAFWSREDWGESEKSTEWVLVGRVRDCGIVVHSCTANATKAI